MANEEKLLQYLKRVTADLAEARQRLHEAEEREPEPLAIIGTACRYPGGVHDPEALWQLVHEGRDAIGELPAERGWGIPPGQEGAWSLRGGFLDDADRFDAALFGISPREALTMDPQQRLLLETVWEAFERADIPPLSLRGSRTGVFVGAGSSNYGVGAELPEGSQGHLMTGVAGSVVSGRIAYTFGLEGPVLTVDTACSSSLVALHQAARALSGGECDLAVAAGVTVMAGLGMFSEFGKHGGLAADGRCKAFGAGADGTGWAEGSGVLVLERLSDARARGHRVLAVVSGSAVNSDGASNGLTAPSGRAQRAVIRAALTAARILPSEVDAVEAHGTGTRLGDPIEAQALMAAYGTSREEPLWLGSVKSNIGHAQAAAGMAGVIKMVEALRHGVLPRTLHAEQPSPHIDWSAGTVRLLAEERPWLRDGRPRRVGVSSFGMSGTNAHVILSEAPEAGPSQPPPAGPAAVPQVVPCLVSARTADALAGQAERLRRHIEARPDLNPLDIARTLATTRSALEHRAAVLASDRDDLIAGLSALAAHRAPAGVVRGEVSDARLAVLFAGQGSQRVGMGRGLYEAFPVFAEAFDAVCARVDAELGRPLAEVVFGDGEALGRTVFAQAGLFALEVALFRLVESWGVVPDVVVGHSVGEVAAAHVAGVLSLDDACALVSARGRLMQALPGGGAMLAVEVSEEELDLPAGVDLAAVNGPTSVTVSGDGEAVAALEVRLRGEGRKVKRLAVSHAFHSRLMEPMLAEFTTVAQSLTYHAPSIPVISTLTGGPADPALLCAPEYWVRQVREPVRFADAVASLYGDRVGILLELGPDGTLAAAVRGCLPGSAVTVAAATRRDRPEPRTLLTALSAVHTAGVAVNWNAVFATWGGQLVPLPTYAFQRDRYWVEPGTPAPSGAGGALADPAEARFWEAVEHADADTLADTLGLPDPGLIDPVLPAIAQWRRDRRDENLVDSWRYRTAWRPLSGLTPATEPGTWLAVLPAARAEDPLVSATLRALRESGAHVREVTVAPTETGRWTLAELLGDIADEIRPIAGVVSLLGLDDTPDSGHPVLSTGMAATLLLTQAVDDAEVDAPLWTITNGAVAAGGTDRVTRPEQAQLWGMGRVAALEAPARWGGMVDVPDRLDDRSAAVLAAVLTGSAGEDQVAVRESGAFVRRIVRATPAAPGGTWRPEGTVLITGGTGALGAEVARWLSRRGAGHLVLVGRRGADAPGTAALVAELAPVTRVTVVAGDVTDRAAMAALLAEHAVRSVVHAAGVTDTAALAGTDLSEFADVLDAKVRGAAVLDALLSEAGHVDRFILFSSIAGVWGSAGQAAYAAANAYLDALAERRRGQGLPATSVAWGPWDGAGMAQLPGVRDHLSRRGLTAMAPGLATTALAAALDQNETVSVVADVDWGRFAPAYRFARDSRLFDELTEAADPAGTTRAAVPETLRADWIRRLAALPADDRPGPLVDLVREETAAALGHASAEAIGVRTAFRDLGVDSLTAVELRDRLALRTGLDLPVGLLFDHPRPAALGDHLAAQLAPSASVPGPQTGERPAASAATPDEPIAIIGIGCRFPGGVRTPEDLWRLLAEGGDAVSAFPTDRDWNLDTLFDEADSGTSSVRRGGFLHDAAHFDAAMFNIPPREATATDPQQRLLLETSWEAMERAGVIPASLRGSDTGVFVGSNGQDYGYVLLGSDESVEGHLTAGATASVLSGRISYTFGLEGPAVTVDTACSSALVATHLAVKALRGGECSLALAGGVSVMSTPGPFVEFSRLSGLAADGRCKAFADSADGTGWGEGVGVLLLERLSDARRNGHRVLAVLSGSAVNQDGASNGLTAPSGHAQQRVIRAALADAGCTTSEVDAVEAHGTGTTLGDPIEAEALLATYGQDRDEPLWTGSVKSNISHTQAASGMAGVIKMVLAMRHGILPKTLHIDKPTTKADWAAGHVALLTEARPWPETGRPRRAGVSSFGASGTNTHVILEAPDPDDAGPAAEPTPDPDVAVPLVLSARGEKALRAQAETLRSHLDTGSVTGLADAALTLTTARATFEHRAVVVGADRDRLLGALGSLAGGAPHSAVVTGRDSAPKVAFVFPGQGAQWAGMAVELLDTTAAFRTRFDECAHALAPHVDFVPEDVLRERHGAPSLERVDVVQPLLWAVMVALAEVWRSHGVTPSAVVGHSQGEIAAACVAGALTLADGAAVVALRARALTEVAGRGGMVSVALPLARVEERLAAGPYQEISVAAVNGPASVVVSGEAAALDGLMAELAAEEVRVRRLPVDYASHSAQMEAIRDTVPAALNEAGVTPRTAEVPFYSAVTGGVLDTAGADAGYWYTNLRETVRFDRATAALLRDGHTMLIEISPHPVLTAAVEETATEEGRPVHAVGTLRRDEGGRERLLTSLAEAYVRGAPVDWRPALAALPDAHLADLPTYAFQRERYWPKPARAGHAEPAVSASPTESRFWAAVDEQDAEALGGVTDIAPAALEPLLPGLSSWHREAREQEAVDAWRYQVAWSELAARPAATLPGRWLLVLPSSLAEGTVAAMCRSVLAERHAEVDVLVIDPGDTCGADLADLLRDHAQPGERLGGILSLLSLDDLPHPAHPVLTAGLAGTLSLLHAVTELDLGPLWNLTSGAVGAGEAEVPARPEQAQVWGLGRVAALEHPRHWGGLIDLPADGGGDDPNLPARLAGVLARTDGEDQVAVRAGGVFGRRLRHAGARDVGPPAGEGWRPAGAVLVTGGTGTIGGHVSRWLAAEGAEHLVLTSRSGPAAPGAQELAEELTALGSRVTVVSCDLEDREDVVRLIDGLTKDGTTLRAVMHTAGMGTLAPLADTGVADLARLIGGKVAGARHLDELLDPAGLDAVVYFSSISAVWGVGRHGGYAAGNAYLDALAENRGRDGAPVTSVAWGPWDGGGMVELAAVEPMLRRGVPLISPRPAMIALRQALDHRDTFIAAAEVDWERFVPAFTSLRPSPLLAELPEVRALRPAGNTLEEPEEATAEDGFPAVLRGLATGERERAVLDLIRTHAAVVLGHAGPEDVEADRAFRDVGFDSLAAVSLRNRLAAATGLTLPATLVFDQPTPVVLAGHLLSVLLPEDATDALPSMDELDRLEAALARRADDDLDRVRIVMRLESLLAGRRDPDRTAGKDHLADRLESATDDELFDLVDRDLGLK
ncbi:type I polyketide synthase [Streptomyces sp. ACA25]|uniref:type I polyketide synthase n=1 Tax=Streptomyces sp. ACA25 TaxID=3022596 RepID=UPI002306EDAE|nr:type I polyketide synthase [Streptomyces sp. ACA25]MDB1090368.1 type I polyketide synthase [Streptomyces sp. ACA25]